MDYHITNHALVQFVQRIERVSLREARRRIELCDKAIRAAVAFGAESVKMPCGGRLILRGASVVTVYPKPKRNQGEANWRPRCARQNYQRESE